MIDANSTYVAGSTGGSATHTHTTGDCTLTAAQSGVPAHAHGLNSHTHSVGAHAHGLNSHTHTLSSHTHKYAKPNTPTGSTTLTAAQSGLPAHTHTAKIMYASNPGVSGDVIKVEAGSGLDYSYTDSKKVGWNKGFPNVANTAAAASKGHTHTIGTTSTASEGPSSNTSGAASGNTADSTAFNSGAASGNTANNTATAATSAHNHGNTGSGSTIQPWVGVYMWKRTA